MKRPNKNLLSLSVIALFVVLGIASAPGKALTIEKDQVPADFRGYTGVLLIMQGRSEWNRHVKKEFTRNYKGPIEFVKEKEVDLKYPDRSRYRFLLTYKGVSSEISPGSYAQGERESVLDRQTGKWYSTYSSSMYGKLIEAYSKALEQARSGAEIK